MSGGRWWDVVRMRLRSFIRRERVDEELEKELRFHLEQETAANLARGMTQEEARCAARIRLGGVAEVEEQCRETRRTGLVENVARDVRQSVRTLWRRPGFAAVIALTLALGIGANTAMFSVVYAVLFRPLPYPDPARLVMVWETRSDIPLAIFPDPKQAAAMMQRWTPMNWQFELWKTRSRSFEQMAGFQGWTATFTGGEAERPEGVLVTPEFFRLFGVRPLLGRTFLPEEDQRGNNGVIVLGYGLWQRRFGGDRRVLGRKILVDGAPKTVIGVMPASFQAVLPDRMPRQPEYFLPSWHSTDPNPRFASYNVAGRLKPGVSLALAQAEMNALAGVLAQENPRQQRGHGVRLVPLATEISGEVRPALLVLFGAVACLLLICSVNIANLLLARAAARQREIGMRAVLGAGRWRLAQQMLVESLLLAVPGGLLGLLLAWAGTPLLARSIPKGMVPRLEDVRMDASVLAFGLGLSLLTGVLFGLLPAWQAGRRATHGFGEVIKGRDGDVGSRSPLVRQALVVAEIALTLVLLTGAGLLVRSFVLLRAVDPGFHTDNVLTMTMNVTDPRFAGPQRLAEFGERIVERVHALPQVESAAVTTSIPIAPESTGMVGGFEIEGHPGVVISANHTAITPGYFRVMGIRLKKGRGFTAADTRGGAVIVNQAFVRRYLPEVRDDSPEPVGRRLDMKERKPEIIGVVSDVRFRGLAEESTAEMFVPLPEAIGNSLELVVRSHADPMVVAALCRGLIRELNRDQPVTQVATMEEIVSNSVAQPRFYMFVLTLFAGLALALAAIGVYGVIAYSVAQRTHEIGVRMALGAERWPVIRMVVGQALRLALAGCTLGLAGAAATTRLLSKFLFGVRPLDVPTFAAVTLVLIAVAAAASWVPASRATRVDPIAALRWE